MVKPIDSIYGSKSFIIRTMYFHVNCKSDHLNISFTIQIKWNHTFNSFPLVTFCKFLNDLHHPPIQLALNGIETPINKIKIFIHKCAKISECN